MILVTGLDYSGTSATAGLLWHLGVSMGDCETATPGEAEQQTLLSASGHLRTWPLYEDRGMITHVQWLECIYIEKRCNRWEYARLLEEGLQRYPHQGLKTNAACILPHRPPCDYLIVTHRDEQERQERWRHYLGNAIHYPRIQEITEWTKAAYPAIVAQADYCVEFGTLMRYPEHVVDVLIHMLALTPTPTQVQAAVSSIQRRL